MIARPGRERDPRRIPYPRSISVASTDDPTVYAITVDGHAWGIARSTPDGFVITGRADSTAGMPAIGRAYVPATGLRDSISDLVVRQRRMHRAATPRLEGPR